MKTTIDAILGDIAAARAEEVADESAGQAECWRVYARLLLQKPLDTADEIVAGEVLDMLGITAAVVAQDRQRLARVAAIDAAKAEAPTTPLSQLIAERDRLAEEYEAAKKKVTSARAYAQRTAAHNLELSSIRNERPELFQAVDELQQEKKPCKQKK